MARLVFIELFRSEGGLINGFNDKRSASSRKCVEMKRLLSIIMALTLALSTLALAEGAFFLPTEKTVAEKLEGMLPVLDSLQRNINVASEDAAFQSL